MNDNETITAPTQLLPLGRLERSPQNTRRSFTEEGIDELKASIQALGLMQNLVVTAAGGIYHVIAGGRRLEALRSLLKEGKLPDDYRVPCQIVTDEYAHEISLAENTVRRAMHPADEFEAFAGLIGEGRTVPQVAERFGVDEKHVLKRLKLGRVAPELLDEYRSGALDLECLMAFTLTDDRERQLKLYASLQDWQKDSPRHIRSCLTERLIAGNDRLARFVGIDAYRAEGGTTRTDLFGDEVYFENPELLHALAGEKLEAIREELEAEGWGWVEAHLDQDWELTYRCERIEPVPTDVPQELLELSSKLETELEAIACALEDKESDALLDEQEALEARLSEVEAKMASFIAFDPGQQTLAGCFVSIGGDGTPVIERGLVRPEHRKRLAGLAIDGQDGESGKHPKDRMPETLRRHLETHRLQIAQAEIARHPDIAFDLLVFKVARYALATRPVHDGPDVHFTRHYGMPSLQSEETAAGIALETIRQGLAVQWLDRETEGEQFEALRHVATADKQAILAYCLALTLQPKLAPAGGKAPTAYDTALAATGADVADYWRPTRDNYLSRIKRDQLLSLGRDLLGELWVRARFSVKKSELVAQLDRAFADPEKHGRTPQQTEGLRRWLPAGMGFAGSDPAPGEPENHSKAA